jgi:lysophospholipase L1-like esterase
MIERLIGAALAAMLALVPQAAFAEATKWVVSWTGSVQGPYPVGNPSAQPDQRFAFPSRPAGAKDQTLRMMVRPDIWGRKARVRFSNAFGTKPITFDGVYVGLQRGGPALFPGSNRPVTFGGNSSVTIPEGKWVWSDPVKLRFVHDEDATELDGRRLAISFHIAGESGPMTWHAKALTTSYVTAPGAGAKGQSEDEAAFPYSTASWFFVDAVEMKMPADSFAIVAFGDSITDGTASTMNGDDRWPDVLSRRLHAVYGNRLAVVNAGIGGNQIVGPKEYSAQKPFSGGPSATQRLERDVLELSSVRALIWFEGINDFSKNGNGAELPAMENALEDTVKLIRVRAPKMRVFGATVTSALGSSNAAHGFPEQDAQRKELNDYIRTRAPFDAVVDFDSVTRDPATGSLKAEFVPESTTGGAGDKLHPNRAGYLAMGEAIKLDWFKNLPP